MSDSMVFVLVIAGFMVVFTVLRYCMRELLDATGKNAWKATARVLSRFGLIRSFKVLSNVKINTADGKEVVIENMLIGYFGVLLVRTMGAKGEYHGTLADDKWSVTSNGKKTVFDNPVKLLERDESALRALFTSKKIYKIPIEHIIYLSNSSSKTTVMISHGGEILSCGKLSAYLDKTKFEKDNGINVKQIVDAVSLT